MNAALEVHRNVPLSLNAILNPLLLNVPRTETRRPVQRNKKFQEEEGALYRMTPGKSARGQHLGDSERRRFAAPFVYNHPARTSLAFKAPAGFNVIIVTRNVAGGERVTSEGSRGES